MSKPKDFISCICDFTFSEFVTIKIIKLFYAVSICAAMVCAHKGAGYFWVFLGYFWFFT